ncbi:MAG: glycoside hydrolase family 99-like domain-containing protein [Clostridiales bacterium]|jgi:hypothetical protein|nr:glycoside hydrolase family 99-like domain-containing protein [Clostridiales bacterium]
MRKQYDIAAYVWPSYTGDDPRTRIFWPEGIGEWQTVKNAVSKFPGHSWPRTPLWGYVNEADPYVMEMQINAAADHGVNVFIYDWYWYDGRPFLETCLNNGYLKARNNDRVKFYIMWANHDVSYTWDIRNSSSDFTRRAVPFDKIWAGSADRTQFDIICRRMFDKYFRHPSYYRIDGCPVFLIYDIPNLINGLGGLEETKRAMAAFRELAHREGFPGVHIQACLWGDAMDFTLTGVDGNRRVFSSDVIKTLAFDSITNYQYVHFLKTECPYPEILPRLQAQYKKNASWPIPYFPHVSVGWDNNPRYPRECVIPNVITENGPENFEKALLLAREYIDAHTDQPPLITLNSWNEWTETSYIQPDDLYGYGYLEAVKRVFMRKGLDTL